MYMCELSRYNIAAVVEHAAITLPLTMPPSNIHVHVHVCRYSMTVHVNSFKETRQRPEDNSFFS